VGVQRPDRAERHADHVVDVQQQVVAAGGEHRPVEGQIGLDELVRGADGGPQLGHRGHDRTALPGAGLLGGQPGRARLQRDPQVGEHPDVVRAGLRGVPPAQHVGVEQVPRLARADPGAGAGPALQQALAGQHFHALAQRRAAHLEPADQFVLGGYRSARAQLTADDRGAQRVHDLGVPGLPGIGGGHHRASRCGRLLMGRQYGPAPPSVNTSSDELGR
jgi:hypothetical protein